MAIQATSEEQLRLRRRARRRLLGAGTLLLVAAIVLPMLLDKQPRPLDRDIEIRIPSPTTAPLAAPPVASNAPSVAAATPPSTSAAPDKKLAPTSPTGADSQPAIKNEPPVAKSEPKPVAPKPAAEPKSKPPQVTEKAPVKPVQKTEPVQKPTEAALEKSGGTTHFVVQLGAFSNADNVRQLRDKLQAGGIHTYTEAVSGGATRVRAGPFKTREQADSTQAKIALLGVQSTVVSIDKP